MRRVARGLLLAALGLSLAPAAQAQQRAARPAPRETLAAAVDREMRGCIGTVREVPRYLECLDRQNAALEQRLAQAMERLQAAMEPPERGAAFAEVQAAWAAYRQKHCDFVGTSQSLGERAPVERAACYLHFAIARIEELEAALRPPPQQDRPPGQAPRGGR
ncbi:lysozyme inhibitor LprI family protein [Caldovatus aquaticus]|uniref:Lysozyme inhibitor LprI family protein n=1 Tax=Caldovatus aquaticus TaxID=2865671 RepID=A0ABS7EY23_9PROT|nr:lysozyme inhibitor LprI family protein [Caldovatus aquaticus]MBW8268257.1 lysozyme inhibitor LprI family protein [Caldovatus aquaticus]